MQSNDFQKELQQSIYSNASEKTSQDQVLSREEVMNLRSLISKEFLCSDDINSIQNILVSNEIKMTNFTDREKYVIGKYFVWVSEYAKRYIKALSANYFYSKYTGKLTDNTKNGRKEIEKDYSSTYRLLVHTYCYLIRSPLSVKGALVNRFTTNTQEINYSGLAQNNPVPQTQWRNNS